MDEIRLMCEVLSICYQISKNSDADVFFDYAPHCDVFSVSYHDRGWDEDKCSKYFAFSLAITQKNLRITLNKLRDHAEKKGVTLHA